MQKYRFVAEAIGDYAKEHGDQPAIHFQGRTTTYRDLDIAANAVANGLLASSVKPGSRIAVLTANTDRFFEIWHGAMVSQCVLAPINARLAPSEVSYIVNDSQAELIFVDESLHDLVAGIRDTLKTVREIISLSGKHPNWTSYAEWHGSQSTNAPKISIEDSDTAVQMYTSGTTGYPKGVELTHANVLAAIRIMMGIEAWQPGEVALVAAPLFHTAGCVWAHAALQSGGTCVVMRDISPEAILSAIETYRVTHALLVPAVIQMLLQSEKCVTTDCSSLSRILYGASPIPIPRLRQAVDTFHCDFEQGYGLTETVGPVCMLRPEDHDGSEKMKSCGKPVPGTQVRVVNQDNRVCPPTVVGEIVVSSPQVMKGYWNLPDETDRSVVDGWLHTGDAGYFDNEGFLYIHDRIKDMIVSGSENVYPAEVESALSGYEKIADVAVIGVPDEMWGEAVKAVVIPSPGVTVTEQEIIDYAHLHIADFKCPKSVDIVDSIPRNAAGKILKRELRKPYWEGQDRQVG